MSDLEAAIAGLRLALSKAVETATESEPMRKVRYYPEDNWLLRDAERPDNGRGQLSDNWRPSDKRRLGKLSFKAYDKGALDLPTDVWSYQRLFIEQRRDEANLWAVQPSPHPPDHPPVTNT